METKLYIPLGELETYTDQSIHTETHKFIVHISPF